MEITKIGILGTGRLGKALGSRLREFYPVFAYDADAKKGKQVCKRLGFTFLYQKELLDSVDVLLLCIPPGEIAGFFRGLEPERHQHPVYLNTATRVDTPELIQELGLRHLKVIGLKPIGQFTAVRQRIPLVFITAHTDAEDLKALERVFHPLGTLLQGDERKVGPLNRLATKLALRFCRAFESEVRSCTEDPVWVASALRSVAVGTMLDYPPAEDNAYTASILEELRASEPLEPMPHTQPAAASASSEGPLRLRVEGFDGFGGRHCETSALQKVLRHHGIEYSEEFLFGLAGGMGFIFWQTEKAPVPFVGGRNGRFPQFILRLGESLGQRIEVVQTDSEKRAFNQLVSELRQGHPVICYGDIFYLPYFHAARHFGAHAFVVYGLDEQEGRVLVSDRGSHPRSLTLQALAEARGSQTSVFPPRNALLLLRPDRAARVDVEALCRVMGETCDAMLHPPLSNFGLAGLLKFGEHLTESVQTLPREQLVDLLVTTYVNLELAGTGGCAFRDMYRGFLLEASDRFQWPALTEALPWLDQSITAWRSLIDGLLPPLGPAVSRLREALHAKEAAFEKGTQEDVQRASRFVHDMRELWEPASVELDRNRPQLRELGRHLAAIHRAESGLFEHLRAAVDERARD